MSVIVTVSVQGPPEKLEQWAAANRERMQEISGAGKEAGAIAHRFYGSDDGEILVIDEWPDGASFQRFFEQQQGRIGAMMQEVGVSSAPKVTVWRKLETHDEIGWDA